MSFYLDCLDNWFFISFFRYPYHAHSWVVKFQTRNRGHRGTRLCTSIVLDVLHYNPAFISCPLSPPARLRLYSYPPIRPVPPPPATSLMLGRAPPVPTTSNKLRLPASAPISHIGSESVALQYIARTCSASLGCRSWSLQIPHTPYLSLLVDNSSHPPPAFSADSQWYAARPCVENCTGPVQYRESWPTSQTLKEILHELPPWRTQQIPSGWPLPG